MKRRVLIVDDVDFNLEFEQAVINGLMAETGTEIEIETAYTVQGALEKIALRDHFHAMVIDINLPDGSGIEIAKAARNKNPKIRLAALTMHSDRAEDKIFFDIFLKKPIMPRDYKYNFKYLLNL